MSVTPDVPDPDASAFEDVGASGNSSWFGTPHVGQTQSRDLVSVQYVTFNLQLGQSAPLLFRVIESTDRGERLAALRPERAQAGHGGAHTPGGLPRPGVERGQAINADLGVSSASRVR